MIMTVKLLSVLGAGLIGPDAFVMCSVHGDIECHTLRVKFGYTHTLLSMHLYAVDLEDLKTSLCCSSLNRVSQICDGGIYESSQRSSESSLNPGNENKNSLPR